MELYNDLKYGTNRLTGTIVRTLNGAPIYIKNIDDKAQVHAILLTASEEIQLDYHQLDITPFPLGYVNFNRTCFYLSRSPVRNDWRQGLRDKSMVWRWYVWDEYNNTFRSDERVGREIGIKHESIARTILNDFPDFKKSLAMITKPGNQTKSIAFSRDFGIRGDLALLFRNMCVGNIVNGNPVLLDQYFWLKESIQEVVK